MNSRKKLFILALFLAVGFFGASADTPLSARQAAQNRAIRNSPRALEQFPELARAVPSEKASRARALVRGNYLLKVTENRAVASRPRTLEQYPELARVAPSGEELAAQSLSRRKELADVRQNRAVAARPRTLEEYPELARAEAAAAGSKSRQSTEPLELAPLK